MFVLLGKSGFEAEKAEIIKCLFTKREK